jgi:putative acetyltransferase
MHIRADEERDWTAVRAVNESAFERSAEADLVSALREQAKPVVSLVAEEGDSIIGHIMFSPMVLPEHPGLKFMGLAPMAVVPKRQRQGVGSSLVHAGLETCRTLGFGAVVVLGHPEYYPRFGFSPAAEYGISCEYDVPDEVFMIVELQPGFLHGVSGKVKYHAAFGGL